MSSILSRSTLTSPGHGKKTPVANLIGAKHHVEGGDRPSDVLFDRYTEWKHITKDLSAYFEGLAVIQQHTAKELKKHAGDVRVPLTNGNQFIQSQGGFQDVLYAVRDHTRKLAEIHETFGTNIKEKAVGQLQEVRQQLKDHVNSIENETGRLADSVEKERNASIQAILHHTRGVSLASQKSSDLTAKDDPWFTHTVAERQLLKQLEEENSLTKSVIKHQGLSETLEEKVVQAIKAACKAFTAEEAVTADSVKQTWADLDAALQSVGDRTEWDHFVQTKNSDGTDRLVDPEIKLRDPNAITFPGQNDATTISVKEGYLERKKRFTKKYNEVYVVLTPSGYFHEYPSADLAAKNKRGEPTLSFFMPECALSAPSKVTDRKNKFFIEGHKSHGAQGAESKPKGLASLGRKEVEWTYKARSHEDMMGWHGALSQISRTTIEPAPPAQPQGDAAAVNAVVTDIGYTRPELEDDEEEGGSDVEEYEEIARTPAVTSEVRADPLAAAGVSKAEEAAGEAKKAEEAAGESLPGYATGTASHNPTSTASSSAAVDEKKGAPITSDAAAAEPGTAA